MFIDFRGKERERKRKRERNIDIREKYGLSVSCEDPKWGLNL